MHGRRTNQSYGIRWKEQNTKKGVGSAEWDEEAKRCGTYNVGVKDLASAYVLCPRLAEYRGLSIFRQTEVTE